MQPFVSPLIFNAHALPTDINEPHVKVGNHLRVNTHPLLGLPAAPFVVYRAVVENLKTLNTRREVVFTDKNGNTLATPITVTPENPVTAHIVLAPNEVCLWAQVEAVSKEKLDGNNQPGNPGLVIPGSGLSGSIRPGRLRPNTGNRIDPGTLRQPVPNTITDLTNINLNIRDRIRDGLINLQPANKLICEAFMQSAMGPASVGTRSEYRYAFSAPGIISIEIYGAGRVTGVVWIEAHDDQKLKYEPYTIMTLPHSGGARYLSIADAKAFNQQRVETQAPKRRPLQETTDAPPPNTAPLANIPFERARVRSLLTTIDDDLESLINNVSETPYEQVITEKIVNEDNVEVGSSMMSRLGRFFQTLADPGTATYAGYKLLDDDWVEVEQRIIFYHIDAFFRNFSNDREDKELSPAEVLVQSGIDRLSPKDRGQSADDLVNLFEKNTEKIANSEPNKNAAAALRSNDQYAFVGTVAIADRGAPLDKIRPPLITGTKHKTWLPAVPPDALREIEVNVADVRVAGLLAAGKRTPATGTDYANINKENDEGFHLPLVLSLNVDDTTSEPVSEPGTGFIADRKAKAPEIRYFISQQDRFGRWSDWVARNADPGPRPKPPRPEFQGFYQQPSISDAEANKGGRVRVKVSVPEPEALAPGSHLLDRVRLIVFDETLATSTNHEKAEASKISFASDPNAEYVVIKFDGPALQKTEFRKLRLTAHWIDTDNQLSAVSEPQTLKLYDPRPPEQLPVPDKLQYSARPDVTGLSWVEHRWSADSTQANFGIYYTDENRLRSYIEDEGMTTLETALNAAEDAAAVATVFRNNAAVFPDHLFERLRDVQVDFNSGEKGFRHAVSGSLRILNLYKIAAESDSGAKPVLTDLPLVIYGVPNSDPPQRPTLIVEPVVPDFDAGEPDFVARVNINLVAGATEGKTWRLRRSSVESHNLNRMPIVTTGLLGEIDELKGKQTADYRDTGPVQISDTARLKPWTRYTWVAEIQGKPESGSEESGAAVPGRWSSPSDPVSLALVPSSPPEAVTINAINGTAVSAGLTDVTLELSHPDVLNGGQFGSFRLRISRRSDEASALEILREQDISGEAPFSVSGVSDDDPAEEVLINTEYVVELIDPLGRSSGSSRITVS